MSNVNIIKNENKIEIKIMTKANSLSTQSTMSTVAEYNFNSKLGYISQYTFSAAKEYKSLVNWKKAVQRIYSITVE